MTDMNKSIKTRATAIDKDCATNLTKFLHNLAP